MASSEADVMSESAETTGASTAATDAKARREARKARILSSGTDRLARITKTGRGGEADTLYSDPPKAMLSTSSRIQSSSEDAILDQDDDLMLKRAQAAMQGGVLDDDPGEVDISQANRSNSMMGGQQMMGGPEGMPQDMQGMMRMMQGMMGGGGIPPGSGSEPGAANSQSSPFPFPFAPTGPENAAQSQSSTSSLLDTLFNLLRIAVFATFGIALVYGALGGHSPPPMSVTEDESSVVEKVEHMTTLHRWARLAYEKPAHWEARYFDVESFGLPISGIPVFWLFITLELALQSSRIMLQRVSLACTDEIDVILLIVTLNYHRSRDQHHLAFFSKLQLTFPMLTFGF